MHMYFALTKMLRSAAITYSTLLAVIVLYLFNDKFNKFHKNAIINKSDNDSLLLQSTSSYSVEDAEKWRNFLSLENIPSDVKQWYTYSETESARLSELEADDPVVIEYIRSNRLIFAQPADLQKKRKALNTNSGQSQMAMLLTKNKTNGFFIECGAFDGETMSVTLPLEHKLNWSGLLIEAEPNYFDVTLKTRRNTTFIPACLSLTTKPKLSAFNVGKNMQGKIVDGVNVPGTVNVQCLPIYSILLAVNRTTVDVFSLDIEGNELDVLQTIPFDKVDIKIFIVEHFNMRQGKQALHDFMIDKDFVSIPSLPGERKRGWAVWDYIFVKKGSGYKETRP